MSSSRYITHCLLATVVGLASFSAMAQPGGPQGGPAAQSHSNAQHGPGKAQPQAPSHARQQGPGRQAAPQAAQRAPQAQHRGAGPDHQWVKGSRMPQQYRSQHYVVNDWRSHGLQQPGRGQHWVQNGTDYLLVAAATGVIAQIIFGQ